MTSLLSSASFLCSTTTIPPRSFISCTLPFPLFYLRPFVPSYALFPSSPAASIRCFSPRSATSSSSFNDPNPTCSNHQPKDATILLDGCDFQHWLVVVEKPDGDLTRDEIIDFYIDTLAIVLGSKEDARMKIYSVSTRCYYAFGALVSEEISLKIKELPVVRWVLPDSYLDVKNKDYGGEPFVGGRAVPYDPKYHEEWIRSNSRAGERKNRRRNERPHNFDRSRNYERRYASNTRPATPAPNPTPANCINSVPETGTVWRRHGAVTWPNQDTMSTATPESGGAVKLGCQGHMEC